MAMPMLSGMRGLSPVGDLRLNTTSLPPSPLSLNPSDTGESCLTKEDRHATRLQEHWDKSIAKNMNLPDGYHNVHVLIIKWHDDIDQLKVRSEVDDLTSVFEQIFEYEVTEINLEESKTQLQLNSEVSA
ncbi:hypothetical protein N0V90_009073 [Kalmusia sp. IMI 367209]|nr:hypothetical protein N0V90_009073 [Kalmusia sp. IMI 367209]